MSHQNTPMDDEYDKDGAHTMSTTITQRRDETQTQAQTKKQKQKKTQTQTSKRTEQPMTKTTGDAGARKQQAISDADLSLGEKIRLKRGLGWATTLAFIISGALAAVSVIGGYLLVMFVGTSVVPNIFVFIQRGTGVTMADGMEAAIAMWIGPAAFLSLVVLAVTLVLMRGLWAWRGTMSRRAHASLRGIEVPATKESKKK